MVREDSVEAVRELERAARLAAETGTTLLDACAARIDANTKVADRVLTVSRGTGKAVRLAAVISAVAIVAVLISRRS